MIERLRTLPPHELRRLAGALAAGRLRPPYTPLAVQHELGSEGTDHVAATLVGLDADGMAPRHVALLLEALAGVAPDQPERPPVTLVVTGLEAPGAPARDTGAVVRELFAAARSSILVVGYAVHQGRSVFRVLAERMDADPTLRVRLCLDVSRPTGDTSDASEILGRFAHRFRTQEWPGRRLPEVLYDPRALAAEVARRVSLHAKCVVADEARAFVSSANFIEAAFVRNVEIGVLIDVPAVARELVRYLEALAVAGALRRVPGLGG
jgi:phosphatidylserine/phosphatidylglycerophosphate/cardiolipin synthase-like enzyme